MSVIKTAIVIGALLLSGLASAQPRVAIDLREGWRFNQAANVDNAQSIAFDDSKWTAVSLPHTWNRIGNVGVVRAPESNSVHGIGWYRLRFPTPTIAHGKRVFVQFDGVGAIADVWVNGQTIGRHEGAFSRFRFDITAALKPQGENLLVVRADNSVPTPGSTTEHVIPLSGDFFIFGGLYRAVSLIVTAPIHVDMMDFAGPGIYARTTELTSAAATVSITKRIVNGTQTSGVNVTVATRIEDAAGRIVASEDKSANFAPGVTVLEGSLRIANPRRWNGVADPYLYRLVVDVRSPKGELLDEVRQPLGLRTMTFDADTGFFLNGEHLMLVGASMHQDRPVKGWAISRADRVQDFDLLQEMGGNAVRLAHYQHDQIAYDLADARGIVAWAEIPLVSDVSYDGSPPSEALIGNAQQQLNELIRQNYNHPSIAVWSVGNEIDLRSTSTNKPARAGALVRSLNDLAKKLDPSRSTTLADCCEQRGPGAQRRDQLVGLTDVVGYNRYFGWYYGKFEDFGSFLDEAHARHPHLPFAISEYGAGSGLTQHTDNARGGPIVPKGRPHPEEFQLLYHEESWRQLRERPFVWGAFIWNMFDFASDSRDEGDLTDVNEKGMVSYDRAVKKDVFYFYKANWNRTPTLHLVGRRYIDRAYGVVDVKAYSNASEARLSLNGNEVGVAKCDTGICVWPAVHLAPGVNQLAASATGGLTDSMQWIYSGSPSVIHIKAGDLSGYVAPDGTRYGSDNFFSGGEGRGGYRAGTFSYDLPVPDGEYEVTARFVEQAEAARVKGVFDVLANDRVVLKDIDAQKTNARSFTARASGGHLRLDFRPRQGEAVLSALDVIRRSSP